MGARSTHQLLLFVPEGQRGWHECKSKLNLVLILSTKKWWGLFCSGSTIGIFAAHLTAAQGARRVPELEVKSKRPAYNHSYGALALSAAGVSQFGCLIICWKSKIIFTSSAHSPPLCNWHDHSSNGPHNWQAAKPTPEAFNHSTGEFSTHSTGFNETAWGDQTQGFIKLINKWLRPGSYDKIVMGAQDITERSHSVVCTEEVIDLMGNEPPDEYTMLIDIPSDLKIGRFPWSRTIMQNI